MRTVLLVLSLAVFSFSASGKEFYVAPDGLDTNPGSKRAPFATLNRARDALRELKAPEKLKVPTTVLVRAGTYYLPDGFALDASDSGTADAPITYRAFKNEQVILIGGLACGEFSAHEGGIYKARIGTLAADQTARVLVFDGKRQELARYPNRDANDPHGGAWAYVDGERFSMYADSPDEGDYHQENQHLDFWQRNIPRLTQTLLMKPENVREWAHPEHGELSIFPRFNWEHYMPPIVGIDAEARELQLGPGCYYEIRPGDRYFVRGLFEELDGPGEWYLDPTEKMMYFWPPEPIQEKAVHLATAEHVIQMQGCSSITFRGFTLECSNVTAVMLKDCTDCLIAGNTIRNAGDLDGCGVMIEGGKHAAIVGNDIYDVGASGILVATGDLVSNTSGGTRIDNNYIHHVGRVKRDAKGIELRLGFREGLGLGDCVGAHISHNLIHDTPHSGIFVWGAGHTIEYNHLRHTCTESEDTGAIGGGAMDWLSWLDTTIQYNFIHDTLGYGYDEHQDKWVSPYLTTALYPDWAASGIRIIGNALVRAPRSCLLLHSGRDNVVENNILIGGGQSQMHWRGWTTSEGFWSTMVDGWIRNYDEAAQHDAWHEIPAFKDPRAVPLPDQRVMTGNVFRRNILCYEDPTSMLYLMETVPFEHNMFDQNLVYHSGQPLRTGIVTAKAETGPNLLPNPGLEKDVEGALPAAWDIVVAPEDGASIGVADDERHAGSRSLRITPAPLSSNDEVVKTVYLTLGSVPFQPGKAFRLSAWMKSTGQMTPVTLSAYAWKSGDHSWETPTTASVTSEWQQFEILFRLPKEGDPTFKPTMDTIYWRISFPMGADQFWIDDVSLREAKFADEWESWQAKGMDTHSVVADPLFVDAAEDDYRLQPDSPAFELGIKQIPFEKIGPYEDELRASWPIVEAPGAREAGIGG